MKYQVRISEQAERDVDRVLDWFQEEGASSAGTRWYAQLWTRIATLEQHPERCGPAAEADEAGVEVRELLFGRRRGIYRILFLIEGKQVKILRIRHAARDSLSPEEFFKGN